MTGNRRRKTFGYCLLTALLVSAGARVAASAELRLRPQCTAAGSLVKLGDVAEVIASDQGQAQALAAMELFPSPAEHEQRFVRVREIQDLLQLRGHNLAECQFSGASQVTVLGRSAPARAPVAQPMSAAAAKRIHRRLCEAVSKYLDEHASAQQAWIVEAEPTDAQARAVGDTSRTISISGGKSPWTGPQRFEVTVKGPQGPASFMLDAQVSVRPEVVVAVRALPRGSTVREGDVELQQDASADAGSTVFHSLAEVIGRETTRSLAAGRAISQDSLRTPLMVHRGDVVTVYANSSGIRIRTAARARDDGAQGDLVAVESLLDRATYFTRVSGIREVEVYARAARVERAETGSSESIVRR